MYHHLNVYAWSIQGTFLPAFGGCLHAFCTKSIRRLLLVPVSCANNWVSIVAFNHCFVVAFYVICWKVDLALFIELNHWVIFYIMYYRSRCRPFGQAIQWSVKYLLFIINYQLMINIVMNNWKYFCWRNFDLSSLYSKIYSTLVKIKSWHKAVVYLIHGNNR